MARWYENGGISTFSPSTLELEFRQTPLIYSSSAVQDAGAITRAQLTPYGISSAILTVRGNLRVRVYPEDFVNASAGTPGAAGWRIFGVMYVVPASVFGSRRPSNVEIRNAAHLRLGWAHRSVDYISGGVDSGGLEWEVNVWGPSWSRDLQPNTKYWVMCVLEAFNPANGSPRSGVPIPRQQGGSNFPDSPGDTNSIAALGRATSFWTNRTPLAPNLQLLQDGAVVNDVTVPAGESDLFLRLPETNDLDNVTRPTASLASMDRAGAQIQYAPQSVPGGGSPNWQDLPFKVDDSSTLYNAYIVGSSVDDNWGVWGLAAQPVAGMRLSVGEGDEAPNGSFTLSPGDWQIRARTFDYGHSYPLEVEPLGRTGSNADRTTANTYPSTNTSEWSEPVRISVTAQILPPTPLSPVGNVGIPKIEGGNIRFDWLYRNTANPPFPQTGWLLRFRKVGTENWTHRAGTGAGTFTYVPLSTFDLGAQYEWAVLAQDSTGEVSDWSDERTARFWVVAAPGTGDTGPFPDDSLEGATLGIGTHRAFIYRRGGEVRVGEVPNLSHVSWGRVRDDMSHAKIVTNRWNFDSGNLLSKLQTWAYELVIYRDNGFSMDRVWEGPITLLTYENESVTIQARDVTAYVYRRIIKQSMSDTQNGATVVDRAMRVLQNALAPDDPNVLAYVTPIAGDEPDAMQYRSVPEYGRTAFEEIDDMASNAGLDYTAVGRSILLWSTRNRIGLLPEFRDTDLGSFPIVSEYGMSMANYYAVTDGNGLWGSATRLQGADDNGQGGYDETYGIVEMLSSSWASDTDEDSMEYTEEAKEKVRQSFRDFSERSIADRYPPPVIVRVPANTTLNPNAVVSIKHLIPGIAIPLRSSSTLRPVSATQKLDAVQVVEEAGKETISITLSPFSRQDDELEEME